MLLVMYNISRILGEWGNFLGGGKLGSTDLLSDPSHLKKKKKKKGLLNNATIGKLS